MNKQSYKVSLGGIISAISIVIMFLTGFGPFLTYVCPMFAGALTIIVVIEADKKWAIETYAAVSILSLFMTPDREASLIYIFLLGYYPILKILLEKVRSRIIEWILKIAVFNISVISCYWLFINIFMPTALDSLNDWGRYGVLIFLLLSNVVFLIYDYFLNSVAELYCKWFRPTFLRKKSISYGKVKYINEKA